MIIYKDIFSKLKESGYSTARIRNEKLISESTLTRIRRGLSVSTETINTICKLTNEPVENIIEYVEKE